MKLLNFAKIGSQYVNGTMQRIKRAVKDNAFYPTFFPILSKFFPPTF